jgi:hypothetical protein
VGEHLLCRHRVLSSKTLVPSRGGGEKEIETERVMGLKGRYSLAVAVMVSVVLAEAVD